MVEAVVSVLLDRVFILLEQKLTFLGGVHGKINDLQTQLKFMQGFLEDASKKQDANKDVRICVSQIRELAYDAEDVIQSFFVSIIEPRQQDGFWNKLKRYASIPIDAVKLHKLGKKIEAIHGNITALTLNLQNYSVIYKDVTPGSTSTSSTPEKIDLRKTYDYTDEEYTIGLDEDVSILLEKLIDQSKRHQVISICGMGGLGKSTLAKKLFKHKHVTNHFNHFAWVFVSQQFQVRHILQDILIKLTSKTEEERISKMKDDDIARELYELQKAKKCLVVIDDLWEKEDWDVLKHAFPIGNIVGTIVLTTRNAKLGLIVDPKSFIHKPRTLTDKESWVLFQMKAFPENEYTYLSEMETLGKKMVEKCSGLPLAIIVLGGVLATKSSLHEWNLAHESFGMYLRLGEESDYSTIHAVLAISYSELPYHLKPCFLSLSQFPEDSLISTRTLFQLWMTESIVTNQSYEKAQGYLQELIDRCLVQIGEIGSLGRIKSCRLHDLVRDLTLSLSKANKENFLEIIDGKTHTVLADPQISQARRVLVGPENKNQNLDLISLQKNSRLRTLIGQNCKLEASSVGNFKMLRTLRLINCKIESIKEIRKLIYLKYLSIEMGSIDHLPSSLGNLRYLQTFIFETDSEKLRISKKLFANFQELRYISITCYFADGEDELNVGELKNLQTLLTPWIHTKILGNLSNLKKLQLKLSEVKSISKVLNGLTALNLEIGEEFSTGDVEEILLRCPQLQKLTLRGRIEKLPKYHEDFTPKLTKLTLIFSRLKEDPMPLLEKLPNLTFLLLVEAFDVMYQIEMVCSWKGFPRLKTLKLEYLRYLVDWQVKEGSMPNLSHLFISSCYKLKMVPDGIKLIKNLSHFEINHMPKRFRDRVGKEGKDYHKIRHVTSMVFTNEMSSEDEKLYAYSDDSEEERIDESYGEEEYC